MPPIQSRPLVVVAPDSFKGTFSAQLVAGAISAGLEEVGASALILPMSDGGEGSDEILGRASGGVQKMTDATRPDGTRQPSSWWQLPDGTAVVAAAAASGLTLVRLPNRVLTATSRGTGELIVEAARAGARKVIVGVGGTATVDGGWGAAAVVRESGLRPRITALCDVETPWEEAPATFGPQKGASPADVAILESRLDALADRAPRDPRGLARTGAGGGLAGGLWAWCEAELLAGGQYIANRLGLDQALGRADLVITGEGRLDAGTSHGKLPSLVAERARNAAVPCVAVVGSIGVDSVADESPFAAVHVASSLAALRRTGSLIGRDLVDRRN